MQMPRCSRLIDVLKRDLQASGERLYSEGVAVNWLMWEIQIEWLTNIHDTGPNRK